MRKGGCIFKLRCDCEFGFQTEVVEFLPKFLFGKSAILFDEGFRISFCCRSDSASVNAAKTFGIKLLGIRVGERC
ncbi:hypothetical protein CKJ85_02265 [Corynebacterium sp. NML 150383]|uniref:Uncharacterized protein n=1 Tax=Corynebacterium gottingense TaxID=2041036 RepID=A0ABX9UM53_9CORY|nr:hypothetical protein CKJ85_02265 [Corynebacterium sp. NML 150383]PAT13231.1 hypothetical protein CKJ83_04665 [Corynebacterium hadale]RMD20547.1 hypothetical protein EAW56_00105 [Corynebacterium gottingense]